MSRLFYIASAGLLLSSMLTAQKNHSDSQGLPPLIDRELLFGDPEITAAEVSPDGKYLAFMKPWSKTRNIWVKKTDEPFSAAKLLTTETKRPVAGYLWSRDGKFILYAKDKDGDENYNLYSVDPAASPAAGADAHPRAI
jgi:dipeptidyl aminopeptidase/acylaminoacyl peptidase